MSLAITAVAAVGVTAAAAIYSGIQQNKALKQQEAAQRQAAQQAAVAADQADQANNKANARGPNIGAMLAGNTNSGGPSGTLLTGSGGVDPSGLLLGRNTLLGGG